jgi:hypothetical protein
MSAPCGHTGTAANCPMVMDLCHVVHCLTYLVDDHVTAEYSCAQQDRVQRKWTARWDCKACEYKPESVK